jgi:hypothetical protein
MRNKNLHPWAPDWAPESRTCDVVSRVQEIKQSVDAAWLERVVALGIPENQKTVQQAAERRLRKLQAAAERQVHKAIAGAALIGCWMLVVGCWMFPPSAFAYTLTFPPSPDEAAGKVNSYVGVWAYTNNYPTNAVWSPFGTAPTGATNMNITSLVPSPAYLAVEAVGTNYLVSLPTNIVVFNTNLNTAPYTNAPALVSPRSPGTPALSQ